MSGSMQGIWGTFCCTLQVLPSLFIEGEKGGDYFLTDLNSTNGTKVNGKLLAANEEIMLKEGDEVQIAEEKYFWK